MDGVGAQRGSSPLARGGRGPPPKRTPSPEAHPRSRGADVDATVIVSPASGSSPLARGGRIPLPRAGLRVGLIPARAGRTRPRGGCHAAHQAHPRSRGADPGRWLCPDAARGSSPLARGGLRRGRLESRVGRLIPARAGRTHRSRRARAGRSAHPRSRGADSTTIIGTTGKAGSSPLARGGHQDPPRADRRDGLIPARAGRTPGCSAGHRAGRAHPRSRGADSMRMFLDRRDEGSSRSRGADLSFAGPLRHEGGSSPLARGGPPGTPTADRGRRLIPARAGRTTDA